MHPVACHRARASKRYLQQTNHGRNRLIQFAGTDPIAVRAVCMPLRRHRSVTPLTGALQRWRYRKTDTSPADAARPLAPARLVFSVVVLAGAFVLVEVFA